LLITLGRFIALKKKKENNERKKYEKVEKSFENTSCDDDVKSND